MVFVGSLKPIYGIRRIYRRSSMCWCMLGCSFPPCPSSAVPQEDSGEKDSKGSTRLRIGATGPDFMKAAPVIKAFLHRL